MSNTNAAAEEEVAEATKEVAMAAQAAAAPPPQAAHAEEGLGGEQEAGDPKCGEGGDVKVQDDDEEIEDDDEDGEAVEEEENEEIEDDDGEEVEDEDSDGGDTFERESSSSGEGSVDDPDERPSLEAAPDMGDEDAELCAVCFKVASVRCRRCQDETYCGEGHLEDDRTRHKKWCVPWTEPGEDPCTYDVVQDAALPALSVEVLLRVCRCLGARDLARLGRTCRALRAVCRDPHAWSHVEWGVLWSKRSSHCPGVLRVAPALRALHIGEAELMKPKVNLLRCTRRVRELHLSWSAYESEPYDVDRLIPLLRHWRGHLQVVRLGCLDRMMRETRRSDDLRLLRFIDGLGIKELYVGGQLVKAYPGSSKVVTQLHVGYEISGEVLAECILGCRETLTSFETDGHSLRRNPWAHARSSPVRRALVRCPKLREATVPVWDGSMSMLHAWPELESLTIFHFGNVKHRATVESLRTAPVAPKLESLSLYMDAYCHRGLLAAVAASCTGLRRLELMLSTSEYGSPDPVELPRDLHLILGPLVELGSLRLYAARVPSTVFRGLADGALPNLWSLDLDECAVTKKGRKALADLRQRRPDLSLDADEDVADAKRKDNGVLSLFIGSRCKHAMCDVASDSEEQDPVGGLAGPHDLVNLFNMFF